MTLTRSPWAARSVQLLVLGALATSAIVVGRLASAAKPQAKVAGALSLPDPKFLRHVSTGFRDIVADVLWFRAMQYYGEWRLGSHGLEYFTHVVDCVLELDPHFEEGYRFASLVLADDMGKPDDAIALLTRGMDANPHSWWLPFEAGFVEYVVRMDEHAASVWFRRAAEVPGAPDFPKRFAAFVAGRAGDLQVSLVLWQTIAQTTQNEGLRKKAQDYVVQLQAAIAGQAPVPDWVKQRRMMHRSDGSGGA